MKRLLLLLAACASRDIAATNSTDGGMTAGYCSGTGPPILVGDGVTVGDGDGTPDSVCTGTVAVETFVRALCTCEGYATATTLTTDSFDSSVAPYAPGGTTGDVGIDGIIQSNALLEIGGALSVGSSASMTGDFHVAHELDVGGDFVANNSTAADAKIAGNLAVTSLAVVNTLTVPASSTLAGAITAGTTVRAPVTVAPPCACGASDLVDIGAFVDAHVTDNQDAVIGLAPDRLTNYSGAQTVDLPCGIYYLGPVNGDGALTLRITGRVALLVAGDIAMTAPLSIVLATDDAELDLMVSGLFSSTQAVVIGRADHPSRTRLYIDGSDDINLSGDSKLAANVYAPKAGLALSGNAEVFGSLFIRRLGQSAPITIHYDVDVRRADVGCLL